MIADLDQELEKYPLLEFTDSGKKRYAEVIKFSEEHPQLVSDPVLRDEIREQFFEKLQYLNDYGGDRYKVQIGGDHCTLSFSLYWLIKAGDAWEYAFNGGLQFDGCPQPFGSVVIGSPGWWSIHT